jgi:hypothetical protein
LCWWAPHVLSKKSPVAHHVVECVLLVVCFHVACFWFWVYIN